MYLQQLQLNYHLKVKWLLTHIHVGTKLTKHFQMSLSHLVIPASNHGTREVFQEKMVDAGCEAYAAIKALDKDAQEKSVYILSVRMVV